MLKQKIIKNIVSIILGSLIIFFIQSVSHSHSGKTNAEGCHKDNKKNNYHCHILKKNNKSKKEYKTVKVIDGDTIKINGETIRFSGIDTPETTYHRKYKQLCYLNDQKIYCGELSKNKLIEKISNNKINCIREEKKDRWGRTLAECFVNNESLSRYLVKTGYAFDFKRYSKEKFNLEEEYAKENKLGLWTMKFLYPWEWRDKIRKFRKDKSNLKDIEMWMEIK